MGSMGPDDKPLSPCPPELDPKWRFFWRIGPQPEATEFETQNMAPVMPEGFPQWKEVMDMWGGKMLDAVFALAEMAAVGFKMPADAFTSRMMYGPHLLAPTGSDFSKYGELATVLAGFHYDLNFLTIHGKSRYPGLHAWTREGKKTSVFIPDGCLLVQAGKQCEYLTGGHVLAGFHEVIVNDATVKVIERKKEAGESLWRVSSTLFSQIQSDQILHPLAPFDSAEAKQNFPPIKTGDQVQSELKAIELRKSEK
jgi:isopenicillin N synthase-like dioxygenase